MISRTIVTVLAALALAGCEPYQDNREVEVEPTVGGEAAVGSENRDRERQVGQQGGIGEREDRVLGEREPEVGDRGATGGTYANTYTPMLDPTATQARPAESLVATVHGTKNYANTRGEFHVRGSGENLQLEGNFQGLKAGRYAAVLHTYGDCSNPDGGSVGPELDFARFGGGMGTGATPMDPRGGRTDATMGDGAMAEPDRPTGATGTTGGAQGGATGTTGTTGAGGTTGATGGATGAGGTAGTVGGTTGGQPGATGAQGGDQQMKGMFGYIDAKGGADARFNQTLATVKPEMVGMLNGRAVVLHEMQQGATSPGKAVACGVLGIARDEGPATPTNIMEPEQPEQQQRPDPMKKDEKDEVGPTG